MSAEIISMIKEYKFGDEEKIESELKRLNLDSVEEIYLYCERNGVPDIISMIVTMNYYQKLDQSLH